MDNPLVILLLQFCIAGLFLVLRRRRLAIVLCWAAFGWLLACGSSPLPQLLVQSLEGQYPVVDQFPASSYILILGAGYTADPSLPATDQLSDDALSRLVEGVRLLRNGTDCKLVLSGYSSLSNDSQAQIMAQAAIELGVDPKDTLLLTRPTKTREELESFRARFPSKKLVVVTSAVHMPRAMAWCRYLKLNALPAPSGHLIKHDPHRSDYDFVPSYRKLMLMQRALHEYLGLLLVPEIHE